MGNAGNRLQSKVGSIEPEKHLAKKPGVAFVDGAYCPIADAKVSVLDFSFIRSDVTYDVVHVWKGRFFRLDDHVARFLRGLEKWRMSIPYSHAGLEEILFECVRRSGLRDAYVAMVCTRGVPPPGTRDPRRCENGFIAYAIPFVWIATEEQRKFGMNIAISDVFRMPPETADPTIKNYAWRDFVAAQFDALDRGFDTGVLPDAEGNVTEGPGYNIFVVQNGRIVTPARSVLPGITRQTVLDLCDDLSIEATVRNLSVEELRTADEVFLTSTAGGIMPVTRVDGRPVGIGKPGTITERLTTEYWAEHERDRFTTRVDYDKDTPVVE